MSQIAVQVPTLPRRYFQVLAMIRSLFSRIISMSVIIISGAMFQEEWRTQGGNGGPDPYSFKIRFSRFLKNR